MECELRTKCRSNYHWRQRMFCITRVACYAIKGVRKHETDRMQTSAADAQNYKREIR